MESTNLERKKVDLERQTVDLEADFSDCRKCFERFSSELNQPWTFQDFENCLTEVFRNRESNHQHNIPQEWKQEWFRYFDINSDERLDFEEFKQLWSNWLEVILKPKCAFIVVDVQNDFISGTLALSKCPSGQHGEEVVPVINRLLASVNFDVVVYSLDWHPEDHISFYDNVSKRSYKKYTQVNGDINSDSVTKSKNTDSNSQESEESVQLFDMVVFDIKLPSDGQNVSVVQKLWPVHCVQNSWGAQWHSDLVIDSNALVIRKGTASDIDSYSVFWDNQRLSQTELNKLLKERSVTDVYISGLAYDFCAGWTALDAVDLGYRTIMIDDASRGVSLDSIAEIKKQLKENNVAIVDSNEVSAMVRGLDRKPQLAHSLFRHLTKKT